MRSCLSIFVFLLFLAPVQAQKAKPLYQTATNILYRTGELDNYMKERCRLDVYHPKHLKTFPTLVWFHGGGLKAGNRSVPKELQEKGIAVVAVNYRLHPKVKSPAYIEDAAAAVAWTFRNITKYGGNTDRIFIAGHSAGGYLTSMVGLDKSYLAAHDIDANRIAGLIPISGHTITHFTPREEKGIPAEQPLIDRFAPLYHIRRDAPTLILITGDRELELLGRYEENAYLARMMKVTRHTSTRLYELDGFNHGTMRDPALQLLLKLSKITASPPLSVNEISEHSPTAKASYHAGILYATH